MLKYECLHVWCTSIWHVVFCVCRHAYMTVSHVYYYMHTQPSGDSNNDLVCPTPVRPNSYKVGDGWLQFSHGEGKLKTSLKVKRFAWLCAVTIIVFLVNDIFALV